MILQNFPWFPDFEKENVFIIFGSKLILRILR